MKKQAKQFSPHIYAEWGELIQDLSVEKQSEVFNAILKYPNIDIDSGIWRFIKSQIDKDFESFIKRCEKNGEISRNYWNKKQSNDIERLPNDIERYPKHKHKQITKTETNKLANQDESIETSSLPSKKPILNKYGEYKNVNLTIEDYEKLLNKYGEYKLKYAIDRLDTWLDIKPKKTGVNHRSYFKENSWVFEGFKMPDDHLWDIQEDAQ